MSTFRLDVVVKRGSRWFVFNEARTKNLTPNGYSSEREAVERLRQIEYFKAHKPRRDAGDRTERLAAMLAHRRSLGLASRRRAMPRQIFPKAIEASYGGDLAKLVDRARAAYEPLLGDLPSILEQARRERGDSARLDAAGTRAREALRRARERLRSALPTSEIEDVAAKFARQTHTNQRLQLGQQLHQALGVDVLGQAPEIPQLGAMVDHFVAENAALITTIGDDLIASPIDKMVLRALSAATPVDALRSDIVDRYGIGERHARVIARDQVGKLYGQVNKVRQQALGIDEFEWATVNDSRVRDEHEALNGQRFSWDKPPSEGYPGTPIQCRCTGQPVLDSLIEMLSGE